MKTILRLGPYFRPLWRTVTVGLLCMVLYAWFSGFSIGLILPIVDKVFMRAKTPAAATISVSEGIHQTWSETRTALAEGKGVRPRLTEAKTRFVAGLRRLQNQAPPLDILAWLCVISLAAVLLRNAADYGRKIAFVRVEQRAAESIRDDLFHHVVHFPLATFTRIPSGQVVSRMVTDVELIKQFTINTAATAAPKG